MKVKKISDAIHQQVLGYLPTEPSKRVERETEQMLERFGLQNAEDNNTIVNLPLPKWLKTFDKTAEDAVEMFGRNAIDRLNVLSNSRLPKMPLSRPPHAFGWLVWDERSVGWHESYSPESEMAQVLDFETVEVNGEWYPVCCVVLADGKWYVWQANLQKLESTIDYSTSQVIVGHNVGYDRSFLATEYKYQQSGNLFFDTMSAWIASRGFTNQQRAIYAKREEMLAPAWTDETSKNGLADVYEFYTNKQLDKSTRDTMMAYGMAYIQSNFSDVVWYCLKDVYATAQVFQYVYPEMRNSQPSDISLTAQLLLGNTWLPLSVDRFPGYYERAEAKATEVLFRVNNRLEALAQEVLNNPTKEQLESEAMDWTEAKSGANKGVPKWYRDCKGKPTIGSRMAPVLLGCTWFGETVKWNKEAQGWYTDGKGFLPHPEKRSKLLTDLFMQKMVAHVESGVLDAPGGIRELLLDLVSTINWTSLKKRVAAIKTESPDGYPVVLPRLTVTGTVTRRCADNTWQVASNPKSKRIGTELKSMVEAPPGYKLVGADVDSQELWLASALGDAESGFCGSTPLGTMVLLGDKKLGTDPHSVVGRDVGVSRDISKNKLVYACVPMDTQALTRTGWKTYDQLVLGEEVLAYDQATNTNRWTPILNMVKLEDREVWQTSHAHGWTVRSTPDHRWLGEARVRTANGREYVPSETTTNNITKDFKIAVVAKAEDGSGHNGLPRMKYGFDVSSWVLSCTSSERQAFLYGCLISDGHEHVSESGTRTWQLTQLDNSFAQGMMLAAYLEGFKVTVGRRSNSDILLIRLCTNRTWVTGQRLKHEVLENQDVWCMTTAYGSWVMKQGDTITITGNCLYGQGFKGTLDGLLQSLPNASEEDCKDKANKFLKVFKGTKSGYTKRNVDGLASEAFNAMESIANSSCPTTPILKAKMTMALRTSRDFQTTKVNWSIQSSGCDYRDLTVVYLAYFFKRLKIDGRLLITIHDEIRTIVKEDHVKRAVYAIQLAHLCTRAYIIDALNLDCIPAGIAWHSSVDVDTVLRKDPSATQVTPSQQVAIPHGQEVTPSELLSWWTVPV